MATINDKIKNLDPNVCKEQLTDFLEMFLKPSFGSVSKKDIDTKVFCMLQELEVIDKGPSNYDIVRDLHVSSGRARNLIYQASLWQMDEEKLEKELMALLENPQFLTSSDKMIAIEIDNPYLIDYTKKQLRDLGCITDGSFNVGLLKMKIDAFSKLIVHYLSDERVKELSTEIAEIIKSDKGDLYADVKISDKDSDKSKVQKFFSWFLDKTGTAIIKDGVDKVFEKFDGEAVLKGIWNVTRISLLIGKLAAFLLV